MPERLFLTHWEHAWGLYTTETEHPLLAYAWFDTLLEAKDWLWDNGYRKHAGNAYYERSETDA